MGEDDGYGRPLLRCWMGAVSSIAGKLACSGRSQYHFAQSLYNCRNSCTLALDVLKEAAKTVKDK
jgi:DNA-binding helix-hairpin-helix protein with protein kinase domain